MTGISALIIAKNEEANIGPAIKSLKGLADEIIVVVDSQSTDKTDEVARNLGARTFVREWQGYGASKAWAVKQAKGEWILWIDADERVTPQLTKEVISCQPFIAAAYSFPRKAYFLGRWIKHCGWYPGYVTRFFHKDRGSFNDKQVHEGLVVSGEIIRLNNPLLHYTDPNLEHYLTKFNHYTTLAAGQQRRSGKQFKTIDIILGPLAAFVKMYLLKLGFLDGLEGFILSVFSAHYVLVKNLKLWELESIEGKHQ